PRHLGMTARLPRAFRLSEQRWERLIAAISLRFGITAHSRSRGFWTPRGRQTLVPVGPVEIEARPAQRRTAPEGAPHPGAARNSASPSRRTRCVPHAARPDLEVLPRPGRTSKCFSRRPRRGWTLTCPPSVSCALRCWSRPGGDTPDVLTCRERLAWEDIPMRSTDKLFPAMTVHLTYQHHLNGWLFRAA